MTHSPEPWSVGHCPNSAGDDADTILDANNSCVFPAVNGIYESIPPEATSEDMARIVASVNAFHGFPTEAIAPFMDKIREIFPHAGRLAEPDALIVYRVMACQLLTDAFDILHQHSMEWEQNS